MARTRSRHRANLAPVLDLFGQTVKTVEIRRKVPDRVQQLQSVESAG